MALLRLRLDELEVLAENLVSEARQVDGLSHGLVNPTGRLFHFFVFGDQVLLDPLHFRLISLDSIQLVVRLRALNPVENLQNVVVFVLHIYESHLLSLVFSNEFRELLAPFNLIEALNKLVCKGFNPLDILILNAKKCLANLSFPLGYDVDVWRVLYNSFCPEFFDALEVFQLLLVLLVDVVQVFSCYEALQTLILAFLTRVKSGRSIVFRTVDTQSTLREALLRIHQECLLNQLLTDVPFHVLRGLLILIFIDQRENHIQSTWIVLSSR